MNEISVLGLDIAKNVFSAVGLDKNGKLVKKKSLRRTQVLDYFRKLPPTRIGLEACGGATYWARELASLGHNVSLISPQFVKPYVKSNKNDMADAEAIAEALSRANMRFVPIKTQFQQDIQCLHRIRERLVKNRTSLVNEIRGLLHEYGIVIPQGIWKFRKMLFQILLSERGEKLSEIIYHEMQEMSAEFKELDRRIEEIEKRLWLHCKELSSVKRLMTIPGVGPLTATALIASVGDISVFKNARQFSAWLGIVPKQHTTGGKPRLLGISKRGDVYLRKLMVHGARGILHHLKKREDRVSVWSVQVAERRGRNRAAVALANKNARMVWAVLSKEEDYRCYPVAA